MNVRELSPRDGVRSRQIQVCITEEKWSWLDRMARQNKTSKAEILRFYLNLGLQAHKEAAAKASVGRNAKRQDPQGLGPKGEHAVGEAETPNPSSPLPEPPAE